MATITVPASPALERVLSIEIARVTERAAVAAARLRGRGAEAPGRSNEAVPVIMITYATSEDAVRKALAAVRADKVVSGRPQVIRIEKN